MTDDNQNEDRQQNQQQKKPLTPDALKQRVISQIKGAQLKDVESQIKAKYVELRKAEAVVAGIEESIETIITENADVFE